ncbi:hypothetical protein AB3X94_37365 [Paraburkholderia sp. BR10923]|uniref:hypothetical protein n=1 Tax=Paraburkholderia sp. BR10923 TaxID=3236992 RepID=UPI0034CD5332
MRVAELIAMLEEMPEDAEVRLAQQPNWQFEYAIGEVVMVGPDARPPDWQPDPDDDDDDEQPEENVVYIAERGQLGYLPGVVSRELGWR